MAASYREWLQVLREPEEEGSEEEGGDGLWSKEEVDEWDAEQVAVCDAEWASDTEEERE